MSDNHQFPPSGIFSLFSLAGKHALITGGGSGIGRLIAETLAAAGAKVVVVGRQLEKLQVVTEAITASGGAANSEVFDVTELDSISSFVETVNARYGAVDILVNGVGNNPRLPIADISPDKWRKEIDTNLSSAFFFSQAVAPAMLENGWGRILNIASLQCRLAFTNGAVYGAAKGGIGQLTRAMAQEWSDKGINANALAPGFFPTALTAGVLSGAGADALAARTAIGRNGDLRDLRGAALFLSSPASDYITGQVLFVDGGFSAV